ncbi:MAG: endonuclease MutS2 [candidate division WOR-3 bacterium]
MDEKTLKALDFFRIREELVSLCESEVGRERARVLEPVLTESEVKTEFERMEELMALETEPPLSGVGDVRGLLRRVEAGGVLTPTELWQVRKVCEQFELCEQFFRRHQERITALKPIVNEIVGLYQLKKAIDQAIDESGAVKDNASPRLKEIRAELRERRNQLVERLERMMERNPERFEGPVMVRRERFVLPVKLEAKNQVPGVVHSLSASGQTVFVEPLESIDEQNRLQELRDAETEEVERIRRELSAFVFNYREEIDAGLMAMAALDLLLAKCRFAKRFGCLRPIIDNARLEIVRAKHPLLVLHKTNVVPLDFILPDRTKVVLVSGPNAGGKTVVLKTIGLCSVLLKCGMFVPAAVGTRLPLFERIYADIGDEQSLEADISSFTAHLIRLNEVLASADARTLVLIDEIGAATAPEEGSALAFAILEELRDRGVCTIATTHFNSLKVFVQNEAGMANAGMEFRNGPTYRLIMGIPGESSAFEIAERSGLPLRIIIRAKERMGKEWVDFKVKLQQLDEELREMAKERQEIDRNKTKVNEMVQVYEKRLREFEEWQARERNRFITEQERLLKEMRRQVENLVRELRERQADHESIVRAKRFIEEKLDKIESERQEILPVQTVSAFGVGDIVESLLFHRRGKVVAVNGERAVVEFGNIKLEVETSSLRLAAEKDSRQTEVRVEEFEFVPRLNIRGMTKEEAEMAVSKFLDEAMNVGATELAILHGKGTGALRQMLWRRLRKDARVAEIRFAEPSAGGTGVTVLRLRGESD